MDNSDMLTEVMTGAENAVGSASVDDIPRTDVSGIPTPATSDIPQISPDDIPQVKADDIVMPQMPVVNEFPDRPSAPVYTSYVPSSTEQSAQTPEVYAAPTQSAQQQQPVYTAPTYTAPVYTAQPVPLYYSDTSTVGKSGRGPAIGSLIMGALSIFSCAGLFAGVLFGIIGIVLGVIARKREDSKSMALVGIILSVIGSLISLIVFIFAVVFAVGSVS